MLKYLLVDLDDTLVTSPYSWGMTVAFPKLARLNNLEFDVQKTKKIMLDILNNIDDRSNSEYLAKALFYELGWPLELVNDVMNEFHSNFRPTLYDDTMPFLVKCSQQKISVFLVSNNINAPTIVSYLSIDTYFEKIFTPQMCENCKPKPDLSMWNQILKSTTDINFKNSLLIGNDPSTDGLFAQKCDIPYLLVNRNTDNFSISDQTVQSLDEIEIQ